MCGIAGILRVHPPGTPVPPPEVAIPETWLDILDESIKHRGPDGKGRFRDRATRPDGTVVDVALVHRRMAIIDPAGGAQPMVSLGGPPLRGGSAPAAERQATQSTLVAVVFNGCIYNHRELRKELQAAGHEFVTDHSDTEVLVHGWREWQELLFGRLEGMFAAVVWDRTEARMALARDAFGEKPLYLYHVHRDGAWFNIFGSVPPESTAIRPALGASDSRDRSHSHLARWIRFGFDFASPTPGASSIWPGHFLDYRHRDFVATAPPIFSEGAPVPFKGAFGPLSVEGRYMQRARNSEPTQSDFDSLISASVEQRLEADVDLGCLLSGGVDSSLIAYFANRARPGLRTFTVRMPDDRYDESRFAQTAADVIGTRHVTIDCHPSPATDLVRLIHQIGLPFGDSSILPTYWVCRAARDVVKVALSGDGGDELFLGYRRYMAAQWLSIPTFLIGAAASRLARGADPTTRRAKLDRLIDAAQHDGYFDLLSIYPTSILRNLIPPEAITQSAAIFEWPRVQSAGEAASRDVFFYLPFDLMRKSDSASMAVALELRSPFLDSRLAHTALTTRERILAPGDQRKGLLRSLAFKYLPSEIVDRPKQGFAIPIGDWFRSDYGGMKQLLLDHLNSPDPWPNLGIDLNMKFVRQMLDEHMGTGMSGRIVRDHSQRLYMLLVLSIWAKWVGSLAS